MNTYDLIVTMQIPPCNDFLVKEITVESNASLADTMYAVGIAYRNEYPDCNLISVEYRG